MQDAADTAGKFNVVILGGGTAGWMAAAGLASQLPQSDYAITLIESDEIGTVGVGEATLPHIKLFNDMLGIDEAEFLKATQGTFKLGIEFRDWDLAGEGYIHPFGAYGEPWGGMQFQHHWLRARKLDPNTPDLEAFSFAVQAARANRFAPPSADGSVASSFSYAYHFDAGLYAAFLRDWATSRGVMRVEGTMREVQRHGENGLLQALVMASGEVIEGDLFLDCSGFRSLLLGGQFGVEWEDWTHWLPCDRAFAAPCPHAGPFIPYTRSTAQKAGWTWRIPLQHRVGNGYVFSSRFADDAEALATFLSALEAQPLDEPRLLRFTPGRRRKAWAGNCVAIGLASGFLEPLESTSIYLVQAAVTDLANLMPRKGTAIDARLAAEFNRLTDMQYERVRDFLILHYTANRRHGQPLWDYVRTMELPESLAHKIDLFRSRASLPDYQYGLFARDSWLAVLIGQGILPVAWDPLASAFPKDALLGRLSSFEASIQTGVGFMPSHTDYVRDTCAASSPQGMAHA